MPIRRLGVMIVLIAVMLTVLVWFYPSNSDFRSENPSWNGARDFISDFDAVPLGSLSDLPATGQGNTLIVIPYLSFSSAELEKLEGYINSGGTLLVLDDYGFGNEILEHLGLELRFNGSPLLDPLFDYKNKNLPKVITFGAVPATDGIESLVFNHATSLESVPHDCVIAWSSYFSFLDENLDGEWDEGEPKGPLPVIASFKIADGELVVVADPSILISSMLDMDDNRQFVENITPGRVFFDQSHLPEVPLDEAKVVLKLSRSATATIWGTLGLVLLLLVLTLEPVWHYKGGQNGQ